MVNIRRKSFAVCILLFWFFIGDIHARVPLIRYQMEQDYPPFKMIQNDRIAGFDVDLSDLIFEREYYDVDFSMDTWENVYQRLKRGEIDTCGTLAATEDRKKAILFSKTVLESYTALYTRKGSQRISLNNLNKFRVAVGKGQYTESLLKDKIGTDSYLTYPTIEDAIEALYLGEVDVLFENQQAVNYLLIQKGLDGQIIPQISNLYPVNIAFGVRDGNSQLVRYINRRLDELIDSGAYEELYQKYFFSHSRYYNEMQRQKLNKYALFITMCAVVILLVFLIYLKYLKRKIRREQGLSKSILDSANIFIIIWRKDGLLYKFNRYAQSVTGFYEDEVKDRKWMDTFISKEDTTLVLQIIEKLKSGKLPPAHEIPVNCKDGSRIDVLWNNSIVYGDDGTPEVAVSMGIDVTERKMTQLKLAENYQELESVYEELAATEEELRAQFNELQINIHYDTLTGLPNRMTLYERLSYAIAEADKSESMVVLMFLDLDNFKSINDTMGHTSGDLLLRTISQLLKGCLKENDFIARLAGDEFVFLLTRIKCIDEIKQIAESIGDVFKKPLFLGSREIYMTASIGIAFYPHHGRDEETLLKNADTAMYHAKEMGKNNYKFYTDEMNLQIVRKMSLENNLRYAIRQGEFSVFYQPQIDIKTGELIGTEALIRWNHPSEGYISPIDFIPLAEDTGLIVPVGEFVLKNACAQNKAWQDAGYKPIQVSVNLSARQFQQQNLIDIVKEALDETGLEPKWLCLEITESAALMDYDFTVGVLNKLKKMGIEVSLDDFGTGYSSLNYLKRLPIASLKIDRSFVHDMLMDSNEETIVKAVILLAHSLNLKVIAEGVETIGQFNFLKDNNCDSVQGYLISKPVSTDEFEGILKIVRQDYSDCI